MADNQYKIKSYKIQRTYYKTSKYTLTLFIPPVEALEVQNGYNVNPNAILYLALPWNSETTHKRSIEIRVKNQRSILRKLSEALNWFDSIEDLFVIKDGVLYFNTNYNDLKVKYVSLENSGEQGFKIVPVALERGNNVYEEGVILSINARDNYIELTRDELQELFDKLARLNKGDILVLAGSIPSTLDESLYEKIMVKVKEIGIKVVVDATKNLLLNVLKFNPFLIKPNNHELEEIFDVKLHNMDDIATYAKKLQDMGARNVLVSMGKDGALLLTEDEDIYVSSAPKGNVINSVGAGDSMVAGFICGYVNTNSYEEALKLGAASGSATAFSSDLAERELIYKLLKEIKVERR